MKKTGRRKFYGETLAIRNLTNQCAEWQFVFIKGTAFATLSTGVFVTDGDLLILRPKEKCSLPDGFSSYKCIAVSDSFVKNPQSVVTVGQSVQVKVKGVDLKKNRISLSMRGIK